VLNNTTPYYGVEDNSVFTKIWKWIENSYSKRVHARPAEHQHWLTINSSMKTFLQGWIMRMKRISIMPPAIIRFSMSLLHYHCPSVIWNQLSHLRLALSPNKTKECYDIANSIPLPIRHNWPRHLSIGFVGADNMSYYTQAQQLRTNPTTNTVGYYSLYDTINFWERYLPPDLFPDFPGGKHFFKFISAAQQPTFVNHLQLTPLQFNTQLTLAYNHSRNLLDQQQSHLAYPSLDTPHFPSPHISFLTPSHNLDTKSYDDIMVILDRIHDLYLRMLLYMCNFDLFLLFFI
jgi:hypothetical protein